MSGSYITAWCAVLVSAVAIADRLHARANRGERPDARRPRTRTRDSGIARHRNESRIITKPFMLEHVLSGWSSCGIIRQHRSDAVPRPSGELLEIRSVRRLPRGDHALRCLIV